MYTPCGKWGRGDGAQIRKGDKMRDGFATLARGELRAEKM